MFNKDNSGNNAEDKQLHADIERFDKEVFVAATRYISMPGAQGVFRAIDPVTLKEIPFALGFPEQFEEWRIIRSFADRRGIIYALLDSQIGNQLQLWQVIERFNDDRYPERALEIAQKHRKEKHLQDACYWNALARTHFILTDYEEAELDCLRAMGIDINSIRTKRIYADILHCTRRCEKAHELYREIMEQKIPKDKKIELPIQDLLGFEGDIVNSPIYALSWLKSDKNVNEATWEWANEEFFYSPHFRSQYAFHLIEQKEYLKGFIKLLYVTKEMPWYKDAVVNTYSLIDQLNMKEKMGDEKVRLESIMKMNNWQNVF